MKDKKILIILSLMFVLFVSLSAISAESLDGDEAIAAQADEGDIILADGEPADYYVSGEGSDDNNGTQDSPYKTIEKAIEQSSSNTTTNIHLTDGIYQDEGNVNLTITNDINLIGASAENTILDGSSANWLAEISGGKVKIQDLTIQNFFMEINQTGTQAGIITSDSPVELENVIIADNVIKTVLGTDEEKSTIYTGVLFSTGPIAVNNVTGYSNRINNTQGTTLADLRKLADWGCIICSFNSTVISNSNFYDNHGSRSSVVYAHTLTTLDITNSTFENNSATYCGGVFLAYLNSTTHMSNSIFKNNNGTNAGGIIYQQRYSNMFVENCTFEDNYANTGGSLYAHHYSNLTADNCSFSTGRARTGSAMIGADFTVLTVTNCTFENNNASEGAIMGDEGCQIIVDKCIFNNNIATFGAAVFGDMINDITVTNSKLTNNTATYGGAIFGTFETVIRIINNTFEENKAVNGSVVFVDNTGKLDEEPETPAYYGITSAIYSKDNTFINNTSEDNLLIVNYERENFPEEPQENETEQNETPKEIIDLYVSPEGSDDNNGSADAPFKTIAKAIEQANENTTVNIHLADGTYQNEGNVNLTSAGDINIIGTSQDKTILDGSGSNWLLNINNGAMKIQDLTIQNFFMEINQTGTQAGIITSDSPVELENVIIADNVIKTVLGTDEEKSTIYTGVLFSTGPIAINNVTGYGNRINNTQGTTLADLRKLADWGCVICSFNSTVISNSNFYDNHGSRSSVVYAHTLTTLDITNSTFENNSATYCGGVFLAYLNSTTHMSNSIFKNNNGTNAGGIIYQQRYSNMFVENCTFEDNYANTGGSLYAHHYSNLTADNCSFSTGRARTGSAMIGADFTVLTVTNCTFENNNASEGAIMGDEGCQIIVDKCTFNNNIATFGAAVFGDMINDITVTNSVLTNNTATYGGAIFGTFETVIRIINNTFEENKAVNGSVVFVDNTGKLDEEPETPAYYGITSAIYSKDNTFINNTSEDNLLLVNYERENFPETNETQTNETETNETETNETIFVETEIITSDVTTTVIIKSVDGNKTEVLNFTLKDKDGNALSGKQLNIFLNGDVFDPITDENGTAVINVSLTEAGTYYCFATFIGDIQYKTSFAVSKIEVDKKATEIVLPKKSTYKAKAKTKKYSVTLKDENGNALAKKVVYMKINKKTYKAKTNKKGVAKIKNVKLSKKGTYKVKIKFKGDDYYKKASAKGKIKIK